MMFYRIEDGDVVLRMGDNVLDGWTECDMDEQGRLTLDPVAAEIQRLKDEGVAAKQYIQNRVDAYPSLTDQLDMQYYDLVNGTTVWKDTIQAVKDAHPKPIAEATQ